MADNFYMDVDGVKFDAGKARDTASNLEEKFALLQGVLDEHRGCWGTDDIGKGFASNYVDPEKSFLDNGKLVCRGAGDVANKLDNARKVFSSTDQENAARLDSMAADQQ